MQEKTLDNKKDNNITDLLLVIESRLSRLETKIEDIEKEIAEVREELRKRNDYMRYTIIMLMLILSFIASMFGLGWRPP